MRLYLVFNIQLCLWSRNVTVLMWEAITVIMILRLYSFTVFYSWYHQLIIVILVIIPVIVDQYGRKIDAVMTWPISNTKERIRGLAHSSVLEIIQVMTAPNRKQYYTCLFSKITRWWGCYLMDFRPCKFIKTWKLCWRW